MSAADLVVIALATAGGAFVKSVTGMGYPLFAVPVASLFMPVTDAVVVVSAPNVVLNGALCWNARRGRRDSRDLPTLLVAGALGAVPGTLALVELPEEPILVALAVTIVAYVVRMTTGPELTLDPDTTRRWGPVVAGVAGLFQGAIGVSGPIVASWIHAYRLPRDAFVFSITAMFLVSGATQVGVLAARGEYDAGRLAAAALALVISLAVMPLGTRTRDRLAHRGFDRAVLAVLAASALALVVRAVG